MSRRRRRRAQKQRRHDLARGGLPTVSQVAAAAGLTAGATLGMGGVAQAACTCTVDSLMDPTEAGHTTLRDAMTSANANPGSTITFASGLTGTITLNSSPPALTQSTAIQGPGASQLAISGKNAYQPFYLNLASPGQPVTISGLTLTGGHTTSTGGAIRNRSANLTVSDSLISGNMATGPGGGIYSASGTLTTVQDTTLSNNSSKYGGGGIFGVGGLTVQRSTFTRNAAKYGGGAIGVSGTGTSLIQNATITDNRADNTTTGHNLNTMGGGVFSAVTGAGALTILGSTISGNLATITSSATAAYGGGVYAFKGDKTPTINDTIIANDSADSAGPDLFGSFNSAFSLLKSTSGAAVNQTVAGSDITGLDPQLGPLQNNGGPTRTMKPAAMSPAVDKGASFGLTTDQRGDSRPVSLPGAPPAAGGDGADIGAVELQLSEVPSNAISFGRKKLNKKKGTATIIVNVPGAGTLSLTGRGLVPQRSPLTLSKTVSGPGAVRLKVVPNKKTRRRLNRRHKVRVKVSVTFTPTGGISNTLSEGIRLVKR